MQIPRLREWREFRGLTQKELAQRAGISPRSVAGYEAGAGARPNTTRKVAEALGVEIGDLIEAASRPKGRSPFSVERALRLPDSDSVRLEAQYASVNELQQASLELARFTKPQTREDPSDDEVTHRRVIAHERLGIIEGELERRRAPSLVTLVVDRFNDAMTPAEEASRSIPTEREGREAG